MSVVVVVFSLTYIPTIKPVLINPQLTINSLFMSEEEPEEKLESPPPPQPKPKAKKKKKKAAVAGRALFATANDDAASDDASTDEETRKQNKQKYEEEQTKVRKEFLEAPYTIDDYNENNSVYDTQKKHERKLRKCIAVVGGNYIIKKRDDDAKFRYFQVTKTDLTSGILDAYTTLKTGHVYKPVSDSITNSKFQNTMAHFSEIKLYSSRPDVLSLYIPPSVPEEELNLDAIREFVDYFATNRVENPEAFHEELSAHAYRFRHPNTNISKVFIHFIRAGNTGKTLLCSLLSSLYPHYVAAGVQAELSESSFNAWMGNCLFAYFEELPSKEHKNKNFETFIKQSTSSNAMIHAKYKDAVQGQYKFIVALNTNEPDLYGLIHSAEATRSRLVIIKFRQKPPQSEWDEHLKRWGILKQSPDYEHGYKVFAASFHKYLFEEYVNPYCPDLEKWSPDRYDGVDKDRILNELLLDTYQLPIRFICGLKPMSDTKSKLCCDSKLTAEERREHMCDETDPMAILQTVKIHEKECVWLHNTSIELSLNQFPKRTKRDGDYTTKSITEQLASLGWQPDKKGGLRGWYLEKSKYEQWKAETQAVPEGEGIVEDSKSMTEEQRFSPEERAVRDAVKRTKWADTTYQGISGKFISDEQYFTLLSEAPEKTTTTTTTTTVEAPVAAAAAASSEQDA